MPLQSLSSCRSLGEKLCVYFRPRAISSTNRALRRAWTGSSDGESAFPRNGFYLERDSSLRWAQGGASSRCLGPPATTRRLSQGSGGSVFAFLDRSSRSHRNSAHLSSGGLRFGCGLHAARLSRSVLNVPFQSSIRALMLLHAARRARSSLCGESATRPSSSSRPIGP